MPHNGVMHEDVGPKVRWDHIGHKRYDRLVEVLVLRQFGSTAEVQAVNGRGGDDGVDILVVENGWRTVWQLKYFPEGFDGKHRDRREQIKKSLAQALRKNELDEWVLVMPGIPTRSGWAWWEELKREHPDVRMRLETRTQLDDWCARYPDIVASLHSRDPLLQKAAILNQEKAVLAGGSADLAQRVTALGQVVDDVDSGWTLDFARQGSMAVNTLRAKDPHIAAQNPIHVHLRVGGDPADERLRAFDRALRYGSFELAGVGPDLIQEFVVTGSSLVATTDIPSLFEFGSVAGSLEPEPIQLRMLDELGATTGLHRGVATIVRGSDGAQVQQVFYDSLRVTWTLDFEPTGSLDIAFRLLPPDDADVASVKRLTQLVLAWCGAPTLRLELPDGTQLAQVDGGLPEEVMPAASIEKLRVALEIADDLDFVQGLLGDYFPMPHDFTVEDRIQLRVLRRALEGRQTCDPHFSEATATLGPVFFDTEGAEDLLEGAQRLITLSGQFVFPIAGHDIAVEGAYLFDSGQIVVEPGDQSRLRAGQEVPVTLANADGRHVIFYMPDRMPSKATVDPEPWGLRGIPELPQFGGEQ